MSAGIGARVTVSSWGFFEIYWGHRFDKVDQLGEHDLQDEGIYFGASLNWP